MPLPSLVRNTPVPGARVILSPCIRACDRTFRLHGDSRSSHCHCSSKARRLACLGSAHLLRRTLRSHKPRQTTLAHAVADRLTSREVRFRLGALDGHGKMLPQAKMRPIAHGFTHKLGNLRMKASKTILPHILLQTSGKVPTLPINGSFMDNWGLRPLFSYRHRTVSKTSGAKPCGICSNR